MKTDHHIEAAIVVQGYLMEILLGTIVSSQPNPLQTLDHVRFQVRTQLEDDLRQGRFSARVSTELKQAIDAALSASFDRVEGQLTNPAPPRHDA